MTERYNSYLDDWLPEDDEETEGSYDYDYDAVPKEPETTIDDYEDSRQNTPENGSEDDFLWLYWR